MVEDTFPPKPHWLPQNDMPNLEGKVAIVTGGNTGLGYFTVRDLMLKNAKVFMFSRTPSKGEAACKKLEAEVKAAGATGSVTFIKCDLGSLQSVKDSAEEFAAFSTRLDYLFASGGTMATEKPYTSDGYDLQLGTNSLGHHYLVKLLLPILQETAKASEEKNSVRVCFISSGMHRLATGFDLKDAEMQNTWLKRFPSLWNWKMYGHSKFANILDANAWARKHGQNGIVFNSCHPGILRTDINQGWFWNNVLSPLFFFPSEMGSITPLFATTSKEASRLNGAYLTNWGRVISPKSIAKDTKVQDTWWNWAEEQIAEKL